MKLVNVGKIVGSLGLVAVIGTGCAGKFPPYEMSKLENEAKGIALVKPGERVFGCKSEGDIEATETAFDKSGTTLDDIRKGAENQLRNEAVHTTKAGNKIVLRLSEPEVKCKKKPSFFGLLGRNSPQYVCTSINTKKVDIVSYHIKAEVLSCGEK